MRKHVILVLLCVFSFAFFSCDSSVMGFTIGPKDYDFGDVYIGNSKVMFFKIVNSSDDAYRISKYSLIGTGSSSYSLGENVQVPITVQSKSTAYLTIVYTPDSVGVHNVEVQIYHNAGGVNRVSLTGIGVPAPRIVVLRNEIDFGLVYTTDTKDEGFEIENIGTSELVLSLDFEDPNVTAFSLKSGTNSLSVQPGATELVEIVFSPTTEADLTNNLLISHNAINSHTPIKVYLSGFGRVRRTNIFVDRTSPWDFGDCAVSLERIFDLKISSSGEKDLNVTAINFSTGTEFSLSGVEDSSGNPINLPAFVPDGDFIIAQIKFVSTVNGNFNDKISILHDGDNVSSPLDIDLNASARAPLTKTFNYSGKLEYWTVPQGVYVITIEAWGAEGGVDTNATIDPGKGAQIKGTFYVTPGERLKILVGQQGQNNGGGGGSFIVRSNIDYMLVAGGGGGSASVDDSNSKHGQTTNDGGDGAGNGGKGGTNGDGGDVGTTTWNAGAGGGFYTDGAKSQGYGGVSFVSGGTAGTTGYGLGGFGGGGCGGVSNLTGDLVGGGGGGYSGGGGGGDDKGGVGGGGGSYNNGSDQTNTSGVNIGDGKVVITY